MGSPWDYPTYPSAANRNVAGDPVADMLQDAALALLARFALITSQLSAKNQKNGDLGQHKRLTARAASLEHSRKRIGPSQERLGLVQEQQ